MLMTQKHDIIIQLDSVTPCQQLRYTIVHPAPGLARFWLWDQGCTKGELLHPMPEA